MPPLPGDESRVAWVSADSCSAPAKRTRDPSAGAGSSKEKTVGVKAPSASRPIAPPLGITSWAEDDDEEEEERFLFQRRKRPRVTQSAMVVTEDVLPEEEDEGRAPPPSRGEMGQAPLVARKAALLPGRTAKAEARGTQESSHHYLRR